MSKRKIHLKKYDFATMLKPHSLICILGKRNTGKSTLMCDIMSKLQRVDIALAMSPTESTIKDLKNFIPPCFVHQKFSEKKISDLLELQGKAVEKGKDTNALLVFDDMAYKRSHMTNTAITFLAYNGRHRRCYAIFTCQYAMMMPPSLRNNIDLLIILKENLPSARRKIYDQYFGLLSFKEFNVLMDQSTSNYECLIIDNSKASNKVEDICFWYKAEKLVEEQNFTLCNPVYWSLCSKKPNKRREKDGKDISITCNKSLI